MLLRILRFVFGYVSMEISGFAPERFMNLLIEHEIVVWNVETTGKGYCFCTGRKNFMRMKPYLKKTNMKCHIQKKCGLPFVLHQYRKRTMFVFGFLFFMAALYGLSLFIWEIQVTGEDQLIRQNVLKQISEQYVPLGTRKGTVDCSELEQNLRKDFDEIAWVSCELKGTVLKIYLEEGMAMEQQTDDTPGDVVASCDAVITKMVTRQGTPVVKVGDTVKKGDILISGTVYIYDDNNEIMETDTICADGDVYGNTSFSYEDSVPLSYYQKIYGDKETRFYTFLFLNYSFTPYNPEPEQDQTDVVTQLHKLRVFDYFYLPVGYQTTVYKPYELKQKKRTNQEAKNKLKKHFQKKTEDFNEKKVEIIENNVTIKEQDGNMTASGTLILNEPIALKRASGGNER